MTARIVRGLAAAVLLLMALPAAGAVQSLAERPWERALYGETGRPPDEINVISSSDLYDAFRADSASGARRPESLTATFCAACSGDDWTVSYRFVLPAGSRLLEEFRSASAIESALAASIVGGHVVAEGLEPEPRPATIRQLADDEPGVVEVEARWREAPALPARVRLDVPDLAEQDEVDLTFTVRAGDGLLVTELDGPEPHAQDPRGLAFEGGRDELHEAGFTIARSDASPFAEEALAPPTALAQAATILRDVWMELLRVVPLLVLLGVLAALRTRALLPGYHRTARFEVATRESTVVVAAAMLVTALGWRVTNPPTAWLDELNEWTFGWADSAWGYAGNVQYTIAALLLGLGLPVVARRAERHLRTRRDRGASAACAGALIVALLLMAVSIGYLARAGKPSSVFDEATRTFVPVPQPWWPWIGLTSATCLAVVVLLAAAGRSALGRGGAVAGAAVGAWAAAVNLVLPWTDYAGGWPMFVRFAALTLLMAATLHALGRLTALAVSDRPLRDARRRTRAGAVLVALLVATPLPTAASGSHPGGIQWFYMWAAPSAVATALPLLGVAGVLAVVWTVLRRPATKDTPSVVRLLTVVLGALLLYSPTALVHYLPLSYVVGVALLWWFALPDPRPDPAVVRPVAQATLAGLANRLVAAQEADADSARLRKGLDAEFGKGTLTWAERTRRLDEVRAAADRARTGAPTGGLSLPAAVLGSYPQDPWEWARRGALAGLVAGLPWMLLAVPGLLAFVELRGYGPLSAVLTAAVELLRWPAVGLVYALGYPVLRGTSGMAKSLTLFVALAVPSAVSLLLTDAQDGAWRSFLYLASQQFILCLVLGLIAEAHLLRRAGRPMTDLTAVHNLRAVVTWVSGLVAAVATAASTAVVTGVTTLVLGILAPQEAPTTAPPESGGGASASSTPSTPGGG